MSLAAQSVLPEAETNQHKPISVFVLIDALGWKYVEGRDFLLDILPFRQPLKTVLGFSSGAIPAMLTGVSPAVNGHWNLFYYDPQGSPFRWFRHFLFLPDWLLEQRITRKLLKEMGSRLLGLGPLFECCVSPRLLPYFNWVERRNIYDRGGIAGASSIFDQLHDLGVPFRVYTYHHFTDTEILREAEKDIRNQAASFYFLYLSEMDMFLHMNCDAPEKIEDRLHWYGNGLRRIFGAVRQVNADATFALSSDHGMTRVTEKYDLLKHFEGLSLRMPKDYLAVFDSTMARFWFFNDQARKEILGILDHVPCGRVLSDVELKQFGVFFPDRRFGEAVFLLHPGWLLSRSDFNGSSWKPVGMHGYHPEDPYSDGVFLSNRAPASTLQSIQDVHQWMLNTVQYEKA
ncbi:MAG TPA: alkaline phosphatase family protein [Candidatus Acidoferrales bacterium]|nr:alkaline phosphatase family protein [Candidatus Acidoferrales bacterium]